MPDSAGNFTLGTLFFNEPGPDTPRHPWIVISDPAKDPSSVVIVNLSTTQGPDNPGCQVQPSEHRAISRLSYVRYEHARKTPLSALEKGLMGRVLSVSTPVSSELLKRIQRGLLNSRFAAKELKEILKLQGL